MPVRVYKPTKEQMEKVEKGENKPHVNLEKGERPWTSHYFESRDDTHPKDTGKNYICKVLAKERVDGKLTVTIVWLYQRAGHYSKYEIPIVSKEEYDELIQQFSENVFKGKKIRHEVAFLTQITETKSLMYG